MVKKLSVTIPTNEAFQAFGALISNENKIPDGGDDNFNWWERIGLLKGIDAISINILEAKKREMSIAALEYHQNSPEIIVPLSGGAVIVVVAPAGKLDEREIKAFKIESGTGVILNAGVRHFIPYPLENNVNCLIIFKDATGVHDLTFDQLSDNYRIEME